MSSYKEQLGLYPFGKSQLTIEVDLDGTTLAIDDGEGGKSQVVLNASDAQQVIRMLSNAIAADEHEDRMDQIASRNLRKEYGSR